MTVLARRCRVQGHPPESHLGVGNLSGSLCVAGGGSFKPYPLCEESGTDGVEAEWHRWRAESSLDVAMSAAKPSAFVYFYPHTRTF